MKPPNLPVDDSDRMHQFFNNLYGRNKYLLKVPRRKEKLNDRLQAYANDISESKLEKEKEYGRGKKILKKQIWELKSEKKDVKFNFYGGPRKS